MSNLIASQSSDVITLVDGTRIEIDTDMYNSPIGFIVTSGPTPAAPDLPQACAAGNHYTNDGNGRWFDFCPDCGKPVS